MSKVLRCADLGLNCDFVARGATEQDVLQQAATHAQNDHQISEISDDLMAKVKSAVHDE